VILSQGQEEALTMLRAFLAQDEHRVALLTGYAGTGKTTLIKVIDTQHRLDTVLTPTGKATLRVTEATGLSSQTIHRFLYVPQEDAKTGEIRFVLKGMRDFGHLSGGLILIDEASMVHVDVWHDLRAMAELAGFKILLMGDRFQLPPVSKDGAEPFSALDVATPFRVNLTEVIRQALDSPIIRASMLLRSGRPDFEAMALLEPVASSRVVSSVTALLEKGGAVVVHRNATRYRLNTDVRQALGFKPDSIQPREPLLVLQNNYFLDRYNGELVRFESWEAPPSTATTTVVRDRWANVSLEMAFGLASVENGRCLISPDEVTGRAEGAGVGARSIRRTSEEIYTEKLAPVGRDELENEEVPSPPHLHCNYGYALTCHKSQGSEWPEVLVIIEPSLRVLGEIERRRWLYTAITRAKTRVSFAVATP
jgi:exodeoxyribonuclease-5